jgi:hypothetical protein
VSAGYLPDGRLAEKVRRKTGTELVILDGDGRLQAGAPRFWFPAATRIGAFLATPDRILAREWLPVANGGEERAFAVLDLRQGTTHALVGGLHGSSAFDLVLPAANTPLGASPLFVAGRRFVRIDLDTGRRHLVGPPRRR